MELIFLFRKTGPRKVCVPLDSFHSLAFCLDSIPQNKMSDWGKFVAFLELQDDCSLMSASSSHEIDDIIIFSVVTCFMRRNLTRIQEYYEATIPSYLPSEFKSHFRMTQGTFQLLSNEIMQTGRIPLGNPSGRPPVPPEKQILTFMWIMANQEPVRAVADRFNITVSSVHRTLRRVTKAMLDICKQYIKWPNGK